VRTSRPGARGQADRQRHASNTATPSTPETIPDPRVIGAIRRGWPRDRIRRHHIGVYALQVAKRWRVGNATFYPAGWLRRQVESVARRRWEDHGDDAHLAWELEQIEKQFADIKWATSSAVAIDPAAARDQIRNSVGLLRLYERRLAPVMNMDHQTFGLAPEIGYTVVHHVTISGGRIPLQGETVLGIPPIGWTFTRAQIDRFSREAEYAYLDQAIRTPEAERTDLQKRVTTALRFLSLATAMLPESVRVVLIATGYEELLGDPSPEQRRTLMSRRAAYLTCGLRFRPTYWSGNREACFLLWAKTNKAVRAAEAAALRAGGNPYCSWYEGVGDLFNNRNAVLHDRVEELRRTAAVHFEAQTDEAICSLAAWAAQTGSKSISDLDDAIDRLVKDGPRRAGVT
jgi:hypothetical protein